MLLGTVADENNYDVQVPKKSKLDIGNFGLVRYIPFSGEGEDIKYNLS